MLWQVDQIYVFTVHTLSLEPQNMNTRWLDICVEKIAILFREKVVKII